MNKFKPKLTKSIRPSFLFCCPYLYQAGTSPGSRPPTGQDTPTEKLGGSPDAPDGRRLTSLCPASLPSGSSA